MRHFGTFSLLAAAGLALALTTAASGQAPTATQARCAALARQADPRWA